VDAHFGRDGERAGNYVAIMWRFFKRAWRNLAVSLAGSSVGKYYRVKEDALAEAAPFPFRTQASQSRTLHPPITKT